jgi:plasmid stabilization system protein ParE
MVVRWTDVAEERLKNIFDYYFEVAGYTIAASMVSEIKDSVDNLKYMPLMDSEEPYLSGRQFVYRSLVVKKIFKIVYFIDEKADNIVIATIWDCRRNPLKLQKEILN